MKSICFLILACLLMTACSPSTHPTPTLNNEDIIATGVSQGLATQTIQAAITQTLLAMSGGKVDQPTPPPATVIPTDTPMPIGTPIPEKSATPENTPLPPDSTPKIIITGKPGTETIDTLEGRVEGVNPDKYAVACYIQVLGAWWTKPTFAEPVTTITRNGTWSCAVITGGSDNMATKWRAYLIPINYTPPRAEGYSSVPSVIEKNALAWDEATSE